MTSRMISIAAKTEFNERTVLRSKELLRLRPPVQDSIIRSMDDIEYFGDNDHAEDGFIRRRSGMVSTEIMTATVKSYGGELVVTFWQAERKHSRRFLVDAHGTYWMDANGIGVKIGPNNKYFSALDEICTARAN